MWGKMAPSDQLMKAYNSVHSSGNAGCGRLCEAAPAYHD